MAYSFDNRVKFIIRNMYDIDNNGFLDKNDFECLALRTTIIELRGNFEKAVYENNRKIMINLWNEISELADLDKNGEVSVDEFKSAIQKTCTGKSFAEFPQAFKTFIGNAFKTMDVNGDGLVGIDEYRLYVVQRSGFTGIQEIDDAYNKLLSDEDRKAGGITLQRYQELHAQFISSPDDKVSAVYLFGPLQKV